MRAALDRNHADELEQLLNELKLDRAQLADAERRDLGRAYLSIGEPAQAIELLRSDDSETLLLKARALAQVGDLDQGRTAYRSAVAANPALEDRALAAELDSKVIRLDTARQGTRKVAQDANDDTDAIEITRLLRPETERVKFADIGGLEAVKKQIHRRIILPFRKPSLFQRFRRKAGGGRGVLR